ncbi:MAG TPA: hypothetical protein VH092_37590, partial [Urbifossiella sp.]|nr:hypothetical protein [Urbifossiella sp.]
MNSEITELERQIAELNKQYNDAIRTLNDLFSRRRVSKGNRVKAFDAWREAGTALFNANEQLVATASRAGLDLNPTWFNAHGDSAANLLEVIYKHYKTLKERAADLNLPTDSMMPSRTAFASLQRLVKRTNRSLAQTLRDEFLKNTLPTHGFDTDEVVSQPVHASRHIPATWEKIVAAVAALGSFLGLLYSALRNTPFADPNQVVILRILLGFSVAMLGAVLPGFLHVGFNKQGFAARAGGALALFLLAIYVTPDVIHSPTDAARKDPPPSHPEGTNDPHKADSPPVTIERDDPPPQADVLINPDQEEGSARPKQIVELQIRYPLVQPPPSDFELTIDGRRTSCEAY